MNIWLIQTGEPVPVGDNIKKMRTAILADKLVERGHSVLWWVSAFDHFKKDWIFKRDTGLTIKDLILLLVCCPLTIWLIRRSYLPGEIISLF